MRDGVVELAGELASHSERLAAMTAAQDAASPAPVQSAAHRRAAQGRDFQMTDADIAIEVARALVQSEIPPGSVLFEVKNRIVTLRGRLATPSSVRSPGTSSSPHAACTSSTTASRSTPPAPVAH